MVKNDGKKSGRREFLSTTGTALAGLGVAAGSGGLLGWVCHIASAWQADRLTRR